MSGENHTIYIENMKQKRCLINKIKNIGLSNNGIIYGGLVRDEIIALHYRHQFIHKELDFESYWDIQYDPESAKRTIIPNDMDIYFKNVKDVINFTNNLSSFTKLFNGYVNSTQGNMINDLNYINTSFNINHTKIKLVVYIGKTINFTGIKLSFDIDVIYADNSSNEINNQEYESLVSTMEPPFNHLDFLSNIFIIERINDKNNIRISNNTGTPIDKMPFTIKNQFITRVINDMLQHKTQFVRHIEGNYNVEYINIYRILKMIDRPFHWNITNIPITILNSTDVDSAIINDNICCICIENFDKEKHKENKVVSIHINKTNHLLHHKCFITYMQTEQKKRYRNPDTGFIECRCPYRNPFNFKDCHLNVNYYI